MTSIFTRHISHSGLLAVLCLAFLMSSPVDAQWQQNVNVNSNWQPGNRWQLGVGVQNTNTGILLTQVVPGSPAANQGLMVGDRILAVCGQQVGYVDGRLVDLGDAINRYISPTRQITLLVLTARGQLRSRPLTLASSAGVIQGTALFQRGVSQVSPEAVMNLRMLDVTQDYSSVVVVAEASAPRANRNPFNFEMTYDPTRVYDGHQYAIEAQVVDRGRIVFQTQNPVIFAPNSSNVRIVLVPTATQLPSIGPIAPGWSQTLLPYEQVTLWYKTYLGRLPTQQELKAWANHLNRGQPVTDIQSYLLSSSEFYDRHQNNPDLYLRGLYRSLYSREPTPQQLQAWRYQYDQMNGVRSQFVQQLVRTGP
jgi:uncharacterized lipoprotein YbaY